MKGGEGEGGHAVKFVQDAVKLLQGIPGACHAERPSHRVGHHDGGAKAGSMLEQILTFFAIRSEVHRQMTIVFDYSTGHYTYDSGPLLAAHVQLRPGGEQPILDDFEDDDGKVHTTFKAGDELLLSTQICAPKTMGQLQAEKDPKAKRARHPEALGKSRRVR